MSSEDRKKQRVTLVDVARQAGVSRATASLVIRKSPLVGAATRARVEAAMRELGYVYNKGAARLRAERSHTVGVIVPNLTNPFFAELLSGLESVIDAAGMVVILANSGDRLERQDDIILRMLEHGVDGVIACLAAGTGIDFLDRVKGSNLPLVQVLRQISDDTDYAGADYAGGMRQAVEHLALLGHETIAFAVHGAIQPAYLERVEGFRQAMQARGLDPDLIIRTPYQTAQIPASASLLFDVPVKPTAVICFNDVIALGLSAGLYDLGIRVGKTFSLIGFDDVTDAESMRPRLTSISTAPVSIGESAAKLMLDRLADPARPPRRIVQKTRLRVRQSCVHRDRQTDIRAGIAVDARPESL